MYVNLTKKEKQLVLNNRKRNNAIKPDKAYLKEDYYVCISYDPSDFLYVGRVYSKEEYCHTLNEYKNAFKCYKKGTECQKQVGKNGRVFYTPPDYVPGYVETKIGEEFLDFKIAK